MEIYVVGKQWMWKVQHPEGVREINELHVPIGRNVRLTIGSEDVLHDYSIPAFRVKMDVVPGKLTTIWFRATVPGTYHLFCAEYCGTKHSGMIGQVIAMTPQDYEAWLAGGRATAARPRRTASGCSPSMPASRATSATRPAAGPSLHGLYGSKVALADGRTVDRRRELPPRIDHELADAKVVHGYQPIMPAFQGMLSEENLMQLIAYIKTLKPAAPAPQAEISHARHRHQGTPAVTSTRRTGSRRGSSRKDHKRIAMLYLISITIFFALGGLFATLASGSSC